MRREWWFRGALGALALVVSVLFVRYNLIAAVALGVALAAAGSLLVLLRSRSSIATKAFEVPSTAVQRDRDTAWDRETELV